MKAAILLRHSLIPYIYSAARTAYTEGLLKSSFTKNSKLCVLHAFNIGLSLIRPMYYEFPENEEAYSFRTQVILDLDEL